MADPSIVNVNTLIVVVSALATVGSMWLNNKNIIKNLNDRQNEHKAELSNKIDTEKRHAVELGNVRFIRIEKDIDSMRPVLKACEDGVKKNCLQLTQLIKDCEKKHG